MEEDDGHGIQQPADAQPPDADEMECVEDAVEYLVDDKPQMVMQGLYIGSAWAEMNKPGLITAGITDILQVAQGLFPRFPLCYKYMVLQVEDSPSTDLVRYFPKCFEFIDTARQQGGSVLVHCAAGVSRSATVVLGYLMARQGLTLAAALEHLKAVRPWVAPNSGFLQQLEAYEAAGCDLTDWTPWHLVYCQQQQQDGAAGIDQQQQHHPPLPPQPQQWLSLPQPCGGNGRKRQQQQQQQHQQPARCESAPAGPWGGGGSCSSSSSGRPPGGGGLCNGSASSSNSLSGASSLTQASLPSALLGSHSGLGTSASSPSGACCISEGISRRPAARLRRGDACHSRRHLMLQQQHQQQQQQQEATSPRQAAAAGACPVVGESTAWDASMLDDG